MTNEQKAALARAIEMLHVAGDHCRTYAAEDTSFYDEADCDGGCIAEDCGHAIEELNNAFSVSA